MYLAKKTTIAIMAAMLLVAAYLFVDFMFMGSNKAGKGIIATGSRSAIVVLTGGRGRADEGLRLLKQGEQEVLILSGVNTSADLDAIFPGKLDEVERGRIILEKGSTSTIENAVEAGKILVERRLDSVVLITSNYHMRRALYVFERVLPPGVSIVARPVSTPNFDSSRWWEKTTFTLLAVEYSKYCLTVAKFAVWPPR